MGAQNPGQPDKFNKCNNHHEKFKSFQYSEPSIPVVCFENTSFTFLILNYHSFSDLI